VNLFLFLLTRDNVGWDQTEAFLVAATGSKAARATCSSGCSDECADHCEHWEGKKLETCVWRDPEKSRCERIGTAKGGTKAGVILRVYKAG